MKSNERLWKGFAINLGKAWRKDLFSQAFSESQWQNQDGTVLPAGSSVQDSSPREQEGMVAGDSALGPSK